MRTILATMLILVPSIALAGKVQADRCATGLPPDAKAIYNASLPGLAAASDRIAHVTDRVTALATSGQIQIATARQSAEAAGACLRLLGR